MPTSTGHDSFPWIFKVSGNFSPKLSWGKRDWGTRGILLSLQSSTSVAELQSNGCMFMVKFLEQKWRKCLGKDVQDLIVTIQAFLSGGSSNVTARAFLRLFLLGSIFPVMRDVLSLKFQTWVFPRYLKEIFLNVKCLLANTTAKNMLAVKMRSLFLKCTISLEKYLSILVAAAKSFSHSELNLLLQTGKGRMIGFFLLDCVLLQLTQSHTPLSPDAPAAAWPGTHAFSLIVFAYRGNQRNPPFSGNGLICLIMAKSHQSPQSHVYGC